MMDIRLSLRASVGLIVRAPSPVACAGMTEIRRFVPPGLTVLPGVVLPAGCRLGVLALDGEPLWFWSGVRDGVSRSLEARLGVSSDLILPGRGDAVVLEASPPLASLLRLASLTERAFWLSALDFLLPPEVGLTRGRSFSDNSGAMKVPGPIDFLGAWTFPVLVLLKAFGGKWLCLRPLSIDVVVVVVDIVYALEALGPVPVEEFDPFLPIDAGAEDFLVANTGTAGCVVFLCSSWVFSSTPSTLPLPGMGK